MNHGNGEHPQVGIIMGSASDLDVMKGAADVLDEFDIGYEMRVVSAHRSPERMVDYALTAREHWGNRSCNALDGSEDHMARGDAARFLV